ncbi:hypothetical protein B0H16DRAFT_1327784 [Mycena metata]|uniref:CxC2-like cysteine cluster KDZ transposase-associated domain-containing protein n=1 Tax=Mycena metata TaxID=1033252 RepID=A0AAD7I2V1_9AGAR|nr:hypothetical protein B0H16DRAFT_1327784 [Mycena metata]
MTKRKKTSIRHFNHQPNVSADSAPGHADTAGPSRARVTVLREKTSIRQSDGHVRQDRSVVEVSGYAEPANVEPDVARPQVPVYDWYDGGDVGVDRADADLEDWEDEDQGPRDARKSVSNCGVSNSSANFILVQDDPLGQWADDHLDTYLSEVLRLEGRGEHANYLLCPRCNEGEADHRCAHCFSGGELLCRDCIVAAHAQLPFHRIEYWTGNMFERKTLKQLGLRIQLGHWSGATRACAVPVAAIADDFVVVDVHGVHDVALDYCGCGLGGHPTVQLLRAQLWPATSTNPKTATTFAALRHYHLMSFESKCSGLEFYRSLERQSDNLSYKKARRSKNEKDRYPEFLRMTRQWRHVRMLKRAARGHDPLGIANTKPGECALLCPACPQPGKNMTEGWEKAPPEKSFLYALFVAMDANFRLKRKDVSTEKKDPGLSKGWGFYCDVEAYMKHVKKHWNHKQDRSHCVAHDAVDKPDREARGTASSGIGAVDCARHNMKRPLAVGDLQLGERYINMDYMFLRSIADSSLVRFVVSYDIVCQWHIHVWDRMRVYRDVDITIDGLHKFVTFLIPKFHLPAHIEECNLKFSFNLTRNVGQTDGEAPERGWANANPLARSTKEMGPGSRRDTLDDHFNDWNHGRIIALGYMLRKKTRNAVVEMVHTKRALQDLEESLGPEVVAQWEAMAVAWEADSTSPNPFETIRKDLHVAKVRAELAEEAAAREAAGTENPASVRGDMHITELIGMGMQLEDQQRILASDITSTGLHPTDGQRRAMIERTSKLRRKIFAWVDLQTRFFPGLKNVRELEDEARASMSETEPIPGVSVSDVKLWLPSQIAAAPQSAVEDVSVRVDVQQHEYRLRIGQAQEALHEVRRLLVRTHVYQLKDEHARGVRANMRSQDKIDTLNAQTRRSADQYRSARLALVTLGRVLGRDEWERTLLELHADDVRGLPQATFHDPERKKKKRRKKKKNRVERPASWIWTTPGAQYNPADGAAMHEAVRIEWAKVRARSHRWREEVDLLEEEMGRVVRFFFWRAEEWSAQVGRKGLVDGPQLEGETAYARRQAAVQLGLAESCAGEWQALPDLIRRARAGELEEDDAGNAGDAGAEDESDEEADGSDESSGEEEDPIPAISVGTIKPAHVDEVLAM